MIGRCDFREAVLVIVCLLLQAWEVQPTMCEWEWLLMLRLCKCVGILRIGSGNLDPLSSLNLYCFTNSHDLFTMLCVLKEAAIAPLLVAFCSFSLQVY